MLEFSIDQERCVQCGECASVCPMRVIAMADDGFPVIAQGRDELCLRCQHCLAVCPTAALSILGKDPDKSVPLDNLPSDAQMEQLIRGRRSVRSYKKEAVDPEVLERLLDVVSSAPTGKNNLQTRFTVVDDPAMMDRMRAAFMEGVRKGVAEGRATGPSSVFEDFLKLWDERGIDIIFRGAPHMIVASSPKQSPTPQADCLISLSYFELFANSLGLGTLWDGFAVWAMTTVAPELPAVLGIPEDHVVGYVMTFGTPDVTFRRAVQRDPLPVHRVSL
ncbi:nitroreductase family protein [Pseudodesulfovibrio senegalensis]|uniref:4Fe-4S dicluster domain-containing protein n=1 Tax=Pseudodesulfovibrio senegalensis TaxID=1721087 RepID=A0A6N6N3S3_9BACT|nr:nitroreductase family protein [Pseudodesulfovibrio senegalensis]KAB1442832.1 4Fe-4S dicluster domain-containing protein [Pseudodesulfovibrio senegalensis]